MRTGINFISFRSYQGTEIFARHLISGLIGQDTEGTYVIYGSPFLPKQLRITAQNARVETVNLDPEQTVAMGLYQQVVLPLKLMASGISRFYSPLPSVPLLYPGRKIMTIHDCAYDRFAEYKSTLSRLYIRFMYQTGKYLCDTIVTVSEFSKQELISLYRIKPEKIKVIYNSVPDLPATDSRFIRETLQSFHINGDYFFYIGNTRPRKNIPGLLKAFTSFCRNHTGIYLVLAGRIDTSFIDVGEEVRSLGIGSRVIQTGFITDQQKAALYRGATALVFPSFYEGFGLPVIEAQSMGTPVLTSNTSSLPEIAGEGALLVDPRDTGAIERGMEQLMDPAARAELREKGLRNVRRFSWEQSAAQLMQILNA